MSRMFSPSMALAATACALMLAGTPAAARGGSAGLGGGAALSSHGNGLSGSSAGAMSMSRLGSSTNFRANTSSSAGTLSSASRIRTGAGLNANPGHPGIASVARGSSFAPEPKTVRPVDPVRTPPVRTNVPLSASGRASTAPH